MCNKEIDPLGESESSLSFSRSGTEVDQDQHQTALRMDSPSINAAAAGSYNDENPRVKFLCSFSGSILPRPQDGKLRYVGGETRIVSVPRDISYEDLMGRMRELYDGAAILKYQQPDEDLDALVSVVNDDDVTNMMEEYDKLGSGDGITRLRIFLFSHPDHDASLHYIDGDERDTERRYVDALNSLNESPDYRRHPLGDSPGDETHIADQFFSSVNMEGSLHNPRNYEMPPQQYNLRHLAIPNVGLGNQSGSGAQRYNDELPWSPGYYSPRCAAGPQDPHPLAEIPASPSSQYIAPLPEFRERCVERMQEEYNRLPPVTSHTPYDHPGSYSDNVVWVQPGSLPAEKGGFPGNILQGSHNFDGGSVCGNCRVPFHRNHSPADPQWKYEHQSHIEHSPMGNEFIPVGSPCVECPSKEEVLILNPDLKAQHGIYNKEQIDPRSLYAETPATERGWVVQHSLPPRAEEPRGQISGAGRVNDHYVIDGTNMKFPIAHGSIPDSLHGQHNFVHHEEARYIRAGPELGNDVFHGQAPATGSHVHVPLDERNVRHVNMPYTYGVENPYQLSHGHQSVHALYRNVPTAMPIPSAYDVPSVHPRSGTMSPAVPRAAVEGSPIFSIGVDPHTWVEPSYGGRLVDGATTPEYSYIHAGRVNPSSFYQDKQQSVMQDTSCSVSQMSNIASPQEPVNLTEAALTERVVPLTANLCNPGLIADASVSGSARLDEKRAPGEGTNPSCVISPTEGGDTKSIHVQLENDNVDGKSLVGALRPVNLSCDKANAVSSVQPNDNIPQLQADNEDFMPNLVASVNKANMESVEAVKARAQEDETEMLVKDATASKKGNAEEKESAVAHGNSEHGSDSENPSPSKIEPTKAEEEAIAKGLQTIRNDDLEEIRELGSGTYGAVYHGKWKGSDVAIKRIKASCFTGRPTERERLIADFWKEALLLSSLHHPNVVSFYGVVRDGPDGSLATVTEFMVNGSLKQYLQKKDRTIDRRKRLIIAMDAAFGMEYLHGKNIVHFDLKCENLLVNMRDPHRPVCKIGDLGLSKVKQHTLVSGGVRGTLPWMAPELLSGKSHMVTEKIDVYSFGIVMWEVLTGDEPYADMHCASIIGGIVNNSLRPEIPAWCDPEWKALMESCWAPEPSDRPSFTEISQKLRSMAAAMNVK